PGRLSQRRGTGARVASEVISASTTGTSDAPADAPGTQTPDENAEVAGEGNGSSRPVSETDGAASVASDDQTSQPSQTSQVTHAEPAPKPAEPPQPAETPQPAHA